MAKELTMRNGDASDADLVCEDCDKRLPPSYDYCPYCGDEL